MTLNALSPVYGTLLLLLVGVSPCCAQPLPFSTKTIFRPVASPAATLDEVEFVTADLDMDGDDDFIFFAPGDSSFLVMLNALDGLSSAGITYPSGVGLQKAHLSDIDADGDIDLVLYREDGNSRQLSVHANDGAGAFASASLLILPSSTSEIHMANIDGDSLPDVVRVRPTGSEVMVNVGGQLWQGATPIPFLVGDILFDEDGDGDDDIIRSSLSLQRIRNNGGAFSGPPVPLGSGQAPVANARMIVSDIDGDADDDLVLLSTSSAPPISGMQSVRRTAQGWVIEDLRFAAFADLNGAVAVGDPNGDGAQDLLMSRIGVGGGNCFLAYSENNGTGGLAPPEFYYGNAALDLSGVACTDVTGDGRDDLIGALSSGVMLIAESGSAAAALPAKTIQLLDEVADGDMRFADFDQDGEMDAVVHHRGFSFAAGASLIMSVAGQATVSRLNFGGALVYVQVGDVDRDGNLDIVGLAPGLANSTIHVLRGDGAGGFVPSTPVATAGSLRSFELGDIDGDGWADILTADGQMNLIRNDGAGGWLPGQVISQFVMAPRIVLLDIDQDGDLDYSAVSDFCFFGACSSSLRVCLNQGGGNFVCTLVVPLTRRAEPKFGDLNGDGNLDLMIAGSVEGRVFLGTGNGGFSELPGAPFLAPTPLLSEAWGKDWDFGDLNGDGNLDAACEGGLYLLGDGTGSLSTGGLLPLSGLSVDIEVIDLNGDMQPDLVSLDGRTRSLVVLINESPCSASLTSMGSGCAGTGGFAPRLRLEGCAGPGGTTTLTLDRGLPGAASWLYFGPTAADIDFGLGCRLFVDPVGTVLLPINVAGNGAAGQGRWELTLNWPASIAPGFSLALQGVSADPMARFGLASTNGLLLTIP